MSKPNIIILMTDQQRADLRKGRGYALDTMPFLDAWCQRGADFANAYTPNPTCMPARVSMFTGRYASAHKVRTNHNAKDALYSQDLLDVLKAAGYRTALCGKNHSHRPPEDFDFAQRNGHLGDEGEHNESPEQRRFADFLNSTKHMEMHQPAPGGVTVQYPYRNVSSALQFIDQTPREQPFFAWVSFAEPHNPYQVPEPYYDMFPPESLPPITTGPKDLPAKGARWPWLRGVWEKVLGADIERRILRARSNYHGMLRLIDDQFKRLIEGLEERGIAGNTIVFFLSDHGDFVGEYGLIRKGIDLPEVLTRIPMAVVGPGVQPRALPLSDCVNLVDLLPTLCEMLNIDIPLGVQGRSLLPLLSGQAVPEGEFDLGYSESGFSGLYWQAEDDLDLVREGASKPDYSTFDCLNTYTQCGQVRMARKGRYKIQADMLGQVYLYDLVDDPRELHNLAGSAQHLEVKAQMLTELSAAILRAEDPLPVPHHRYRTKLHPRNYWHDAQYVSDDPGVRQTPALSAWVGSKRD